MITGNWKSEEEIDKAYAEHVDSLRTAGIEYDHVGLMAAWVEAIEVFRAEQASERNKYDTL